jgi:hypothetical protein
MKGVLYACVYVCVCECKTQYVEQGLVDGT